MLGSEIDDIFASKGKFKAAQPPVSSSSTALAKKRKRDRKKRSNDGETPVPEVNSTKKRPAPETVVDSSAHMPSTKRAKVAMTIFQKPEKQKPGRKDMAKEDEDRFKDSRGNGPRRKTEEGFLIFKEDELGIGDEGGDTPLCPFDCQCCKLGF